MITLKMITYYKYHNGYWSCNTFLYIMIVNILYFLFLTTILRLYEEISLVFPIKHWQIRQVIVLSRGCLSKMHRIFCLRNGKYDMYLLSSSVHFGMPASRVSFFFFFYNIVRALSRANMNKHSHSAWIHKLFCLPISTIFFFSSKLDNRH